MSALSTTITSRHHYEEMLSSSNQQLIELYKEGMNLYFKAISSQNCGCPHAMIGDNWMAAGDKLLEAANHISTHPKWFRNAATSYACAEEHYTIAGETAKASDAKAKKDAANSSAATLENP